MKASDFNIGGREGAYFITAPSDRRYSDYLHSDGVVRRAAVNNDGKPTGHFTTRAQCNKAIALWRQLNIEHREHPMSDTVTIPPEIPRVIPKAKLQVVGFEFREPNADEWYWNYIGNDWSRNGFPVSGLRLVAITAPIVDWYEPTPLEALRVLAAKGEPVECQVWSRGENDILGWWPRLLVSVDIRQWINQPFGLSCEYFTSKIRLRREGE